MSQQTYPIKMYASKMFKNIFMYKTKDLNSNEKWEDFLEHDYDVEVKGDKARVHSNNPFVRKPSRFCKLRLIEKTPNSNKSLYQLTVNGKQAFFRIAHNINN